MPLFLHAGHQVRHAFDGLRLFSWLAIGLGLGALLLTWGRLLAWIREPELRPASVLRWGQDENGWYFEIAATGDESWFVETPGGGSVRLVASMLSGTVLRPEADFGEPPIALTSASGIRLAL